MGYSSYPLACFFKTNAFARRDVEVDSQSRLEGDVENAVYMAVRGLGLSPREPDFYDNHVL